MADKPAPQTVAVLLKELKGFDNPKDKEPVHFEIDLSLNPLEREVFNAIIELTVNNSPLRTQLIGRFLAYGAGTALRGLRVAFPRVKIDLSDINTDIYSRVKR